MTEINLGYSPEVQKSVEQSERMKNSAALIENPIGDGELGFDKVFIQADNIINEGNKWTVNISSEDPTVILDDKWRQNLGLVDSAIVPEIRKGDGKKKLVSGGTWIWIEDNQGQRYLSLMRRDAGAPVDANCLTGPAGRCGEKLSKTSVDETNQEFIFLQTKSVGETKLLAFYRDDKDKEEVVKQKLRQVGEIFNVLMKRYEETGNESFRDDAKYLAENVRGAENIELLKMGEGKDNKQKLDEITMTIDGVPVDTVKGIAYFDKENNTLEVREVVNIKLPKGSVLSKVMDGEQWLRPTTLVAEGKLKSLLEDDLVPALRNYIEKVV